jgi:RNA polymerase sigma-70 factor (ECF subfamily)
MKSEPMKNHENTDMGGSKECLDNTEWSQINEVRAEDPQRRNAALEKLTAIYWKPVYCYIRRKGYDNEKAKDLTQGFFYEVILGRDLIAQADKAKGRFRTFLLSSLDRYLVSDHRFETAQKRAPDGIMIPLDSFTLSDVPSPASATPEQAFTYTWASSLIDSVLADVKAACLAAGQTVHWEVFCSQVVRPAMEGSSAPPLADVCAAHQITSQSKASNMSITVKRRFQKVFREHVRPLVSRDDEVDAEIQEIMRIIAGGAGAS